MKVLYLIQTFKNLPQIVRLVSTIKRSSPDAAVLVSHNRESFTIDPAVFKGLADVHVTHVEKINRADFRMMQAYLDAIAFAHERGIAFDWVVNFSGQCYPTRPLAEFERLFVGSDLDGYMEYCEMFKLGPENPWDRWEGPRQYRYQYYWQLSPHDLKPGLRKALSIPRRIVNNIQPWFKLDTSYGLHIGVRGRSDLFHDGFKMYGGQYWKVLSRRAVDYLCEFARTNTEVTEYFRRVLIPVEAFPQTVLLNNPQLKFSDQRYYFIRFDGQQLRRPRILTGADYQTIVDRGVYWARKFEPDEDSRVLDMLDARLFGQGLPASGPAASTVGASPAHT